MVNYLKLSHAENAPQQGAFFICHWVRVLHWNKVEPPMWKEGAIRCAS